MSKQLKRERDDSRSESNKQSKLINAEQGALKLRELSGCSPATIRIEVYDDQGAPIHGAAVRLDNGKKQHTDEQGLHIFTTVAGTHEATVQVEGYVGETKVVTVGPGGTAVVRFNDLTLASTLYLYLTSPDGTVPEAVVQATYDGELWGKETTNVDGVAVFAGMPPGTITLTVNETGYLKASANVTFPKPGTEEHVQIKLTYAPGLRVRVVDSQKKPITTATVTILEDGELYAGGTVDETGELTIRPVAKSAYGVTVEADGYFSANGKVQAGAQETTTVTCELTRHSSITIFTDDGHGRAVGGATVTLTGESIDPRTGTTDENGGIRFGGLAEGTYRATATAPGRSGQHGEIDLAAETDYQETFSVVATTVLLLKIRDAKSSPLANATVTLTSDIYDDPVVWITDHTGDARFPLVPATYQATIQVEGCSDRSATYTLVDGKDQEHEITMLAPAVVIVRVQDLAKQKLPGATVEIIDTGTTGTTGNDGEAKFEVAAGSCKVRVRLDPYVMTTSGPFDAPAGQTTTRVVTLAGAILVVKVVAAEDSSPIGAATVAAAMSGVTLTARAVDAPTARTRFDLGDGGAVDLDLTAANRCSRRLRVQVARGDITPVSVELHSPMTLDDFEKLLHKVACAADAELDKKFSGVEFDEDEPPDKWCWKVRFKEKGADVTNRIFMGRLKHARADELLEEAMMSRCLGNDMEVKREATYFGETNTQYLGINERVKGSFRPDVVVHDAGDPLAVQAIYDYKFTCPFDNYPEWGTVDNPLSKKYDGQSQGRLYWEVLQPRSGRCKLVNPFFGVL